MDYKDKAIEFANDIIDNFGPRFENNDNGPDYMSCVSCSGFSQIKYIHTGSGKCSMDWDEVKHDKDCVFVKAQKFIEDME